MELIHPSYSPTQTRAIDKKSLITRFFSWCANQEESRLLWVGIIVGGHGCVITPITVLFVIMGGNSMFFWALAIAAMGMSLVSNLAAMPTKITIPVFLFSLVLDVVVIGYALINGLSIP